MASRASLAALAAFAALALLLVALAPGAQAHASRLSCTPEPGARLDHVPHQVVVVLTEPIEHEGATMTVTDQDGRRVDLDDLVVEHGSTPRLTLSLDPDAGDGAYTTAWRVLSKDTHTVSESCGFAVGAFQAPASQEGARQDVPPQALVARSLAYAGLALGLGALGLVAVRFPVPDLPRLAVRATALGAGLHTVGLLLLMRVTAAASDLGLSAFLASGVGRNMALRLVLGLAAFAVAGLALVRPAPPRAAPVVAGAALLAAAIATAAYSHSFAHGVSAIAADAMHLVAAATWAGSLALFAVALRPSRGHGGAALTAQQGLAAGRRYGTLAMACVVVLFLAGFGTSLTLLGLDGLRDPAGLAASAYGRFLLAKVGLALLMVAVAAITRAVLLGEPAERGPTAALQRGLRRLGPAFQPLAAQPAGGDGRGLRRLVMVEAAVGAVVLVVAAALTSISPPADAATEPGGLHLQGTGDDFAVMLLASPAPKAGGTSTLTLHIQDLATGQAVSANTCDSTGTRDTCVDVLIGAGNASSGAERHLALPDGEGGWVVEDVLWTLAGNVTAIVRIQTADVFEDRVAFPFTVA